MSERNRLEPYDYVPTIRVEDWDETPPIATLYVRGDHEIVLDEVFSKCMAMLTHPGRGQLEEDGSTDEDMSREKSSTGSAARERLSRNTNGITPVRLAQECTDEFTQELWACFCHIAD